MSFAAVEKRRARVEGVLRHPIGDRDSEVRLAATWFAFEGGRMAFGRLTTIGSLQIASSTFTTTLVSATRPAASDYAFRTSAGDFISLSVDAMVLSRSGLFVECDRATTKLDRASIDALVTATDASIAKETDFATCIRVGQPELGRFTVRPALAGPGAIFEGDSGDDTAVVLLARELSESDSGGSVDYKGEGGDTIFAAGQHTTTFTVLSTRTQDGSTSLAWDLGGEPAPALATQCAIQGAAAAKAFIHPG
jgi:hypothetical protein